MSDTIKYLVLTAQGEEIFTATQCAVALLNGEFTLDTLVKPYEPTNGDEKWHPIGNTQAILNQIYLRYHDDVTIMAAIILPLLSIAFSLSIYFSFPFFGLYGFSANIYIIFFIWFIPEIIDRLISSFYFTNDEKKTISPFKSLIPVYNLFFLSRLIKQLSYRLPANSGSLIRKLIFPTLFSWGAFNFLFFYVFCSANLAAVNYAVIFLWIFTLGISVLLWSIHIVLRPRRKIWQKNYPSQYNGRKISFPPPSNVQSKKILYDVLPYFAASILRLAILLGFILAICHCSTYLEMQQPFWRSKEYNSIVLPSFLHEEAANDFTRLPPVTNFPKQNLVPTPEAKITSRRQNLYPDILPELAAFRAAIYQAAPPDSANATTKADKNYDRLNNYLDWRQYELNQLPENSPEHLSVVNLLLKDYNHLMAQELQFSRDQYRLWLLLYKRQIFIAGSLKFFTDEQLTQELTLLDNIETLRRQIIIRGMLAQYQEKMKIFVPNPIAKLVLRRMIRQYNELLLLDFYNIDEDYDFIRSLLALGGVDVPELESINEQRLKLRQLQIMVAAELFRRNNGQPPARTGELVEQYLSEIPRNPLTGDQLFLVDYRTTKDF